MRNLKRYTDGKSVNSVKRYLLAQDVYTLQKQRRIHFPRGTTYSKGIADLYQADLVDMTNISRYNDSYIGYAVHKRCTTLASRARQFLSPISYINDDCNWLAD